jgi:hypothetical protein
MRLFAARRDGFDCRRSDGPVWRRRLGLGLRDSFRGESLFRQLAFGFFD